MSEDFSKRPLGHVPGKPDSRDFQHPRYSSSLPTIPLPASYDVPNQDSVYDQGQTPTCVGQSLAGLVNQALLSKGVNRIVSRLAGYVGARSLENPPPDEGTSIVDALTFGQRFGIPPEVDFPFDNGNGKPDAQAATDALLTRIGGTASVSMAINDIKYAMLSTKNNLIAALDVTPGFDSPDSNGVMGISGESRGSHAVNICGWRDDIKCWKIRNSWGTGWAIKGYGYRPYAMGFTEVRSATVIALDKLPVQLTWLQQLLSAFGIH